METPNPDAEWVAVKEGDQDWMKELADMLTGKGIPAGMTLAPGCSAGTCGCRFIILVAEKDVQAAHDNIEEYYMAIHPELRESQEWADQDKCPACGHDVGQDAKECPDCGLLLIIEG